MLGTGCVIVTSSRRRGLSLLLLSQSKRATLLGTRRIDAVISCDCCGKQETWSQLVAAVVVEAALWAGVRNNHNVEGTHLNNVCFHVSHDMSSKKDTENHTMSTPGINKQTSDVHIPNEEAVSLSSVVVFKMGEVHICSSTCLQ